MTFSGEHSKGAVSYAWDFGDGDVSEEANPTHTYDGFGTFDVTLTVTSSLVVVPKLLHHRSMY